ncbi:hypothetical protein FQN57_000327 [Myotisia sp. PD_48]|nr:hypothetical protein FQN57_000327 [Myotisia sp. PD_48]
MEGPNNKNIPKSELEVLSQEIDEEVGYYRIRTGSKVRYLTIAGDAFDEDTLCRPYLLIPSLPDLPETPWITMKISRGTDGALITDTSDARLPGVTTVWHLDTFEVLSLKRLQRYRENVHECKDDVLAQCEKLVRKLHRLELIHGDVNRYNFPMGKEVEDVRLVDFEHAEEFNEDTASAELEALPLELAGETGRGRPLYLANMQLSKYALLVVLGALSKLGHSLPPGHNQVAVEETTPTQHQISFWYREQLPLGMEDRYVHPAINSCRNLHWLGPPAEMHEYYVPQGYKCGMYRVADCMRSWVFSGRGSGNAHGEKIFSIYCENDS